MKKYYALFKTQLLNGLAYPADLFSRSISIVIFMWIFFQLWRTTYGAVGEDQIGGLRLQDTLWYLMLAEVMVLSKPRISTIVAEHVKDGSIAYLLNKPFHFIYYQLSMSLGDSVMRMVFNGLAGGAIVWLAVGPPPGPQGYPLVLAAMLMAWLIDFCMNAMIGMLAFLTEDVSAFEWIYSKFTLILGGVLIPLDFFPDWLQAAAKSLPFAYTTWAPARLFVDPGLPQFLDIFWRQALWLAVLGGALGLFYTRSERRLVINGG